jgi:hypothetical protein
MKFNPLTGEIYTDKDEFVKKMSCPWLMKWAELQEAGQYSRKCRVCNHAIVDTALLSDDELLRLIKNNPETCLKLDLNQQNLLIISNGDIKQH